jgi:hypothetical protein
MEDTRDDRWSRIETHFGEALHLAAGERDAYLAGAISDSGLRDEVARLLASHDRAGGFLESLDARRAAALVTAFEDSIDVGDQVGP